MALGNIIKACLIPSNKNEFKYLEYKIDKQKMTGLCDLLGVEYSIFEDLKNKITQEQLNEILRNLGLLKIAEPLNIDDILDNKILNNIEYDKEILKEILKKIDFSTSKAFNSITKTIDFLKLYEEITKKQTTSQSIDNTETEEHTTTSSTEEETEDTTTNNGLKYLIILFKEFGIVSKDKRANNINPEYLKFILKQQENEETYNPIIDYEYFEPKKTNGRILRPLKLLKVIKEQGNRNKQTTKQQLMEDLKNSPFIEISKQDKQTYYYIKKGLSDEFHKWLREVFLKINKFFNFIFFYLYFI